MVSKTYVIEFSKFAEKQIDRLPSQMKEAVHLWKKAVELAGLPEVRKNRGYHDEPLKGSREGQRSIRLNRSYRLIYEERDQSDIVILGVLEVNKHDYR